MEKAGRSETWEQRRVAGLNEGGSKVEVGNGDD